MIELGRAALILAFAASSLSAVAALAGRNGKTCWRRRSRRGVYALCALLSICIVVLELAFLRGDFSVALVANHSSTTTPIFYKLTAMWSSQAGSLLLWAWVLSIASSAVLFITRDKHPEIVPYATAVLMAIAAFFVGLMLIAPDARPFVTVNPAPVDGVGLNPLLRHPSMLMHPPMLYSGYVFFTVPFAFAIGALITGRIDASWIRTTRSFGLVAWIFLGAGLFLGARWSYAELGWGGYWAWDPVENAALMPWLTGTAFLHSIMVQEKRGMLKVWNVSLIVATFSLSLLGTFLVRSGVLQSIHAFGDSTVGPYILGLIGVVLVGSTALIVSRLDDLRSPKQIDSLLSREAVFIVNNLLLVGLCLVVLWGTFFPLVSEVFTGDKASLAAPWFDRYTTPLAVLLVLFTGIGPLLAWRRVSWSSAKRVFLWPGVGTLIVGGGLAIATSAASAPWALALFSVAAFTLIGLSQEFWRAASARRSLAGGSMPMALLAVVSRNRRRYGGYIVHAGIVVLLVGVAASSSYQTTRDVKLRPGETTVVENRSITYTRPFVDFNSEAIVFGAVLDVVENGERSAVLSPSKRYFRPTGMRGGAISTFFNGETTSEVGLKAGAGSDLWTAVEPDVAAVRRRARAADRGFRACARAARGTPPQCRAVSRLMRAAAADPRLRPTATAQLEALQKATVEQLVSGYLASGARASFRVIVDPLIAWLWVGGLIALAGALIAIWPGRRTRRRPVGAAEAEARKEAKYREIRDAQMDHAAGKLSTEDFRAQDAALRREAIEILDRLDEEQVEQRSGH